MSKALWIGALAGAMALGACTDREIILPGKREGIRDVLADAPLAEDAAVNRSLPIRLAAQSSNAEWTNRPGSPVYRTARPALGAAPQPIWSVPIGRGDDRKHRITADPVVADGRIFALDSHAQVTAVSTAGAVLWTLDLTPERDRAGEASGGGLAYGGGQLYVTSGFGTLTAVDPATGAVAWSQDLDSSGTGTPTYANGLVYLVSGDSTAWAVEAATGRVRWQLDSTADVSNVFGGPAPAVTDRFAIFGFGSGEVQAAFLQGGLSIWASTVVGGREGRAISQVSDITGDPVVDGDRVYVANQSGRLAALSRDNGDRLWTATDGMVGPVWPVGGSLFGVTDQNELVRLDAANGIRIWGVSLPGFVKERSRRRAEVFAHYGPVLAGGRLIVASNDGLIRQFNPENGAELAAIPIPGGATTSPVIAGGTLYVVSTKGQLHAFR